METRGVRELRSQGPDLLMNFGTSGFTQSPEVGSPLQITPAQMVKRLFPEKGLSGKESRYVWDDTSASAQCNALNIQPTVCWLCGYGFGVDDFKAQCDHILPVMQGAFFLDLYSKKTGHVTELMKIEYDWAHAFCNNIKRNSVFISQTPQGTYDINQREIDAVLSKIQQRGISINVNERKEKIIEKLQPILKVINKDTPGIANLNLLSGTASILTNTKRGGRKNFKPKHNGRTVRKSTAKGHGSNSGSRRKVRAGTRKRA